ncbi:MAG: CRTAC1 family protein [Planctomycetota bacterium]|jgi:hypothetical protein
MITERRAGTAVGAAAALAAVFAAGGRVSAQLPPDIRSRYEQLRAQRVEHDRTVWSGEATAQRYERYFVKLWDDLRAAADKYAVLEAAAFAGLTLPPAEIVTLAPDGRRSRQPLGPGLTFDTAKFKRFLARMKDQGLVLEQTEWHHDDFRPELDGPARSTVTMVMHAANPQQQARYQIRGTLQVEWSSGTDGEGNHVPGLIEVTDLEILRAKGPPVFQQRFTVSLDHESPMDDVLVYDLNGDGLSDFVYPSSNLVFFNEGDFVFRQQRFCADPPQVIFESVLADFTGDGRPDYLCAGVTPIKLTLQTRMRLFLYAGDGSGRFEAPPVRLGSRDLLFEAPDCFAVGDVDGDGDLDVWVAQYLAPYLRGQFPSPYYDANDGYPSYLLLNDGSGNMADATEAAGLADKRFRRTFRSSLVDLDDDGDLDLVVVSDFAGIDVYFNDGTGHFTDVTASLIDDPSSFGMSHTFADFDADGRLDVYVTGMGSTTARRLERMGLGRDDLPEFKAMRTRIGYGNRMYLGGDDGRYRQPPFKDDVGRSGWSWGCTSLDYDNDGDPDIYVTNGNKSGRSVQDYCTTFWCHDIYSPSTETDPALGLLFAEDLQPLSAGKISWNGYEHNHFFMNEHPAGFTNVAWLLGVALEEDCRAAVADDFDLDGRPDLLVVAFDRRYRFAKRVVRIFQNSRPRANNWIGVRLRGAAGVSPVGAKVLIVSPGGRQTDAFVTGDSAKSQHAHLKHFGLGEHDRVGSVEVRWPNGQVQRLEAPAINRYHDLRPPAPDP